MLIIRWLLPAIIIFTFSVQSQTVTVKKIAELDLPDVNLYSIKICPKTYSYIYVHYDTISLKSTVYSKNGKIGTFDYVNQYRAIFDDAGNIYYAAGNSVNESTTVEYLFKNDEMIGTYDHINDNWVMKDGILYFAYTRGNRNYFAKLDTKTGSVTPGKAYDFIYFVDYPSMIIAEEQEGSVGFTNDGRAFYVAESAGKKFLVVDDKEMKAYSDIDVYTVRKDKNGLPVYVAKDRGLFYNSKGDAFVVQDKKEYKKKKFDYIYAIYGFSSDNKPVYVAADSLNENIYPQRIMTGDKSSKTYEGGIWDVTILPSGKLAFIASDKIDVMKAEYPTMVVVDGKEGNTYKSIDNLIFTEDEKPVYAALKNNDKYIIVYDDSIIDKGYDYIHSINITDRKLNYIGSYNGDYENKVPPKVFIHLGDKVSGPYDNLSIVDYNNGMSAVIDKAGNYIYAAQKTVDWDKYLYETKAVWNGGESKTFYGIDNAGIIEGKPYYVGVDLVNADRYEYEYTLYFLDKKITDTYNNIMDFTVDGRDIKFTALKGKEFLLVEVKF